ncbi:Trafficking protein particle complex subunit 9 [Orchesella cincta]|uniref:Trafficking protein particle complex subunit 9 n=1 Tax=Orchesella cincta TaxID=48709 RepID=A0A1D2NB25_ORCCI|nr:Trafficking protein particle complex subunit 9 [Orchesella cincta]
MRSAVSVILSGTAPEQNMSYPDYSQTPLDHQSLLVVVRHIGRQLRTKQFNRAFERISRINQLKVFDSQNQARHIWIRYLRGYPQENNDWGDFQTHRKALGLITVGQCNSQDEFNELCRIHESLKVGYAFTLYDSRCILFGLNQDGTLYEESHSSDISPCVDPSDDGFHKKNESNSGSPRDSALSSTAMPDSLQSCSNSAGSSAPSSIGGTINMPKKSTSSDSLQNYLETPNEDTFDSVSEDSSSRSESVSGTIQYARMEQESGGGQVNADRQSGDNKQSTEPKSLIAPTNFKARTLFYPTMEHSQTLETDIEEFIASLFWILESKRMDKLGLRKADRHLLLNSLCAPFEKKDFVGLDLESKNNKRRADGRLKKQLGDLSLQAGLLSEAISHYHSAADILKSVNDWLWLAGALEGMCSASVACLYPQLRRSPTLQRNSSLQGSELTKYKVAAIGTTNSLPPGLDPEQIGGFKPMIKNCLTPAEILEKYREAVTHYGKYRQAGIIETEASIKAALVLIEQRQTLHAADFLQNAVFISLQLTEDEKMQRFNALSELYTKVGFHRKAAFFKRVAAMRCVSPHNPHPNWALCHSLLLQLLEGYKLSLNPNEISTYRFYGWPRLQMQVMQELVGTAKRKGNNALATRHMTFLVHAMLAHMSRDERREFAQQLEALSKDAEGLPVPLAIDNGLIVPPVHLQHIPSVKVFKLVPPTPHLKPEKVVDKKLEEVSPFVYTPFSAHRDRGAKDVTKADFSWVEGELCEVNVILENPLPIELKVSSMCLITEGVKFHVNSNVISIPAESSMFPATLTGKPLEPGTLRILGYSTYTLGVKSNIRLKNMKNMVFPHIDVEIVPALPSLDVSTSKPKSEFFSSFSDSVVTSASISLLMGETQECTVTLTNNGKVPIEHLEMKMDSRLDKQILDIFKWSEDNIMSQLPIQPGASASFTVYIYGVGDFIGQPDNSNTVDNSSVSSLPVSNAPSVDGPSSLPSRLGAISDRLRPKRTESSASNRQEIIYTSIRSPKASMASNVKNYEAVLNLKYSGGPGFKTGHFRRCGVAFNVEVSPTLYITKWDTLPGESPAQFYLVLDLWNATDNEMEVQYAKNKQILVEKAESCRIPVPVDRCPMANVDKGKEEQACCEHIVTNVDLKWVLPECSGKATLQGIRLTAPMVQLVTVSPIHWEITINGEAVKPEEIRFDAGEMISVNVWLRNHLKEALEDLSLSLDCFQDYQNGRCNYKLDSRFAVIGNDSVLIPEICPGSSFQHALSMIFFVPGLYKVDFKCNRKSSEDCVWKFNPPLDIQIN